MADDLKAGVDAAEKVASKAAEWVDVPTSKKIQYLQGVLAKLTYDNCYEWALLHARHVQKVPADDDGNVDISKYGHLVAEGFTAGPAMFANYLTILIQALQEYDHHGAFLVDKYPHRRATDSEDSAHIVSVYPWTMKDTALSYGMRGEVYVSGEKPFSRGHTFEEEKKTPGLVMVLGAGNFAAPIEVLTKMFCEHKVCVYKPNPVNHLETVPVVRKFLAELIEDGYLAVVEGDIPVASAIISLDCTEQVMITGSDKTYDAIVWGAPNVQAENKKNGNRVCKKQVDAELGNVNVLSVVPGHYTDKELEKLTYHIAHIRVFNGGHTCPSVQIVLLAKGWEQKDAFCEKMKKHLGSHLPSPSYYPGTDRKYEQFQKEFAEVATQVELEKADPGLQNCVKPLWVSSIDKNPEMFQRNESFCPVMGVHEIELPELTAEAFCAAAVDYVNERVWGNLSTTIWASGSTLRSSEGAVRDFVNRVRVGAVGVNLWGGFNVFFPQLHWGAYPGNSPEDVQSGVGLGVGNFLQFDNVLKVALWCPPIHDFQMGSPSSPSQGFKEAYRLCDFNVKQSYWAMIKCASAILLGF
jgi:aldehyde dehydrogenase (NAD(P)+)